MSLEKVSESRLAGDHFLLSCYGKTFDEMGESAVERRERDSDCAKMRPEVSTMLSEPDDPYGTVFHHTFRDRDVHTPDRRVSLASSFSSLETGRARDERRAKRATPRDISSERERERERERWRQSTTRL